jgi:hypothetical protein
MQLLSDTIIRPFSAVEPGELVAFGGEAKLKDISGRCDVLASARNGKRV